MIKIDRTNHSPAAAHRPLRHSTTHFVLHHLGVDVAPRDGITTPQEAEDFFVKDPEGIATVCLPGTYESKVPTIKRWREHGPRYISDGGTDFTHISYVPYHFGVAINGEVTRWLHPEVVGAHAGRWNDRSVGIAFLGNFDKVEPSGAQIGGGLGLLADLRRLWPLAQIVGHDETIVMDGGKPKGCPGPKFPVQFFRDALTPRPR